MELSEELKHFTELAAHIQAHYQFATKEKKRIERMITDYLHMLELEDLPAQSQLRLVREIKHLRKERRKWRDILDVEEPFAQFLRISKDVLFTGHGFVAPRNEDGTYNFSQGYFDFRAISIAEGEIKGITQFLLETGSTIEDVCRETGIRKEVILLIKWQLEFEALFGTDPAAF